jgi:molecular chaperone GrpE
MTDKKKKEPIDTQETLDDSAQAVRAEAANQEMIASLQKDLEGIQQELVAARSKADEYLDGWQRSRAEFTNYKKRIEREASQTYQQAAGSVLRQFLGISDDLERALKNRPKEGEGAVWSNGIELVYRKLLNMLENEGVTPIRAEGAIFDPNFHEAIVSEQSDSHESGQVIEVVQQGYMLGEKVLRPAMVRVAR